MELDSKIYIAGHRGLVGSAIVKNLKEKGYTNLVMRTHSELDLMNQVKVNTFFEREKPEYVFLAAAKVGGIYANNTYPADFIFNNLSIQTNVIHSAYTHNVKRLLFLGSSCIYPKNAPQPLKESCLLTSELEPTNRPYALAKISGIEMCWSYNRQYGTKYLAVMPTNLYGPGDNYHPENSHVIPGLIRKFHEAKVRNLSQVEVWGSGLPKREFLFNEDMADACVYLINLGDKEYTTLIGGETYSTSQFSPPLINIGYGQDLTIQELSNLIKEVVGYKGNITFDMTKPDGPMKKLMDISLLKNIGWSPNVDLVDGLQLAYSDFVANHRKNES